ncbi:unnamed protein product [Caenorhabditis auriculariae]|uniref:Uncharacterized protein n=1 Tax=Caenorhabditis auriculariae TaxID=2777116 RepID=A0A8S1HGH5_9PELO|nr:unnamed protein product [Caenorhabditis auriculariae]
MLKSLFSLLFLVFLVDLSSENNFGPACLPQRRNFKLYYPCEEETSISEELEARNDQMAKLRGEPSEFARSGFYDRLFRRWNTPASYSNDFIYWPNYGYNPNLPASGPYRYSNWFVKTE